MYYTPAIIPKESIYDRCKEVSLYDVSVVVFVFECDDLPHESERAEHQERVS